MYVRMCALLSHVCVGEGNTQRLIILIVATIILIVIIGAVAIKAATISWHLPRSLYCAKGFT